MLRVEGIYKSYESKPLLRGVSFDVAPGETVCLLGVSGSGKSTLLRIIAGLEAAEEGRILWEDRDLTNVAVHRRGFGLMFQDYALFPHRSVAENVAFGLRMQDQPRVEIDRRVAEALAQVNMTAYADRRVTDLSGGEQQRIALARALAPRPRLLMLDEPLGALDYNLREQLMTELRDVLRGGDIPAVYVTHDHAEAFTVADRLVLLHEGRVEQAGDPREVHAWPVSPSAARFLGLGNLLAGEVVSRGESIVVRTGLGLLKAAVWPESGPFSSGQPVTVLLRFGAARQVAESSHDTSNLVQGRVVDTIFRGQGCRVVLACENGVQLQFDLDRPPATGEMISLTVDPDGLLCLPPEDREMIPE
jgi:spermidine/putrescine transport system ATP-binding protein